MIGDMMILFHKKLAEQQGATLIIVMMTLTVLSILGFALMAASTTNYMMASSYIDSNRAFYRADGILEQVYVVLDKVSATAQAYANEQVESQYDRIVAECTIADPETGEEFLDKKLLEERLLAVYNEYYNQYIDSNHDGKSEVLNEAFSAMNLTLTYTFSDSSQLKSGADIDILVEVPYSVNKIIKKVQAVFRLLKNNERKESTVEETDLIWMREITTNGNLNISGGNVHIHNKSKQNISMANVYVAGEISGNIQKNAHVTITTDENFILTDAFTTVHENVQSSSDSVTGTIDNLCIIGAHNDVNLYLSGYGNKKELLITIGSKNFGPYDVENDTIKGLIFSNRNINIFAEKKLDFEGAIVAAGNIVFEGDGQKFIDYDEMTVQNVINLSEDARKVFAVNDIGQMPTKENVKILDWKEIR
jgi:Tfp pilus assembly protein PilE